MANNIEYTSLFQNALDTQAVAGATSGWMEANAGQVIYKGGKEIKIPKISMSGLGNYDR
ncbi:MAG: prophage protein, partial [Clostridiaceae bacterium]|nr:prophage protein [Clostridiaceae bacterium]